MKKSILNLGGVKAISKEEQKTLIGGNRRRPDVPVIYNPVCYNPIWVQNSCISQPNATVLNCALSGYESGAIMISINPIIPPPPGCHA